MNIALVATLLMIAAGSPARSQDLIAKAQPTPPVSAKPTQSNSEIKYYTITLTKGVFVHVPDGMKFLEDPLGTLGRNRIRVPLGADVHWKKFAGALLTLANPKIPPSRATPLLHKALVDNELVQLQIANGWIPVAGDWNGDGTITGAEFLKDPVATLREQGIRVAGGDVNSWREVADALRALRRTYARPSPTLNRQNSNQAELTSDPTQGTEARRRIVQGYSAGFYAGNKMESRQVVGSCNSTQGCMALKNVCETLAGRRPVLYGG